MIYLFPILRQLQNRRPFLPATLFREGKLFDGSTPPSAIHFLHTFTSPKNGAPVFERPEYISGSTCKKRYTTFEKSLFHTSSWIGNMKVALATLAICLLFAPSLCQGPFQLFGGAGGSVPLGLGGPGGFGGPAAFGGGPFGGGGVPVYGGGAEGFGGPAGASLGGHFGGFGAPSPFGGGAGFAGPAGFPLGGGGGGGGGGGFGGPSPAYGGGSPGFVRGGSSGYGGGNPGYGGDSVSGYTFQGIGSPAESGHLGGFSLGGRSLSGITSLLQGLGGRR